MDTVVEVETIDAGPDTPSVSRQQKATPEGVAFCADSTLPAGMWHTLGIFVVALKSEIPSGFPTDSGMSCHDDLSH